MFNFISSKLAKGGKGETGSECTSQTGEKGFAITSNQSEFSESVMVAPSENPELNESADQIVLSQLQRENEDLKETREASAAEETAKLERERIQLLRVLDQVYALHTSTSPREPALDAKEEIETPSAPKTVTESELMEEEAVRDLLRNATTADELQNASEKAQNLGMTFEVSLAERKLAKLIH